MLDLFAEAKPKQKSKYTNPLMLYHFNNLICIRLGLVEKVIAIKGF